jgi:hypothetical protein
MIKRKESSCFVRITVIFVLACYAAALTKGDQQTRQAQMQGFIIAVAAA